MEEIVKSAILGISFLGENIDKNSTILRKIILINVNYITNMV